MNLIQLRFNAAELENARLLAALKAGHSAYRHLHAQYVVRLVKDSGWFMDVFIGGTPFEPERELVTATLLSQGIAFDISVSPVGVDGEALNVLYGLRRSCDEAIIWHDQAQTVGEGSSTEELDLVALDILDIKVQVERVGNEVFLYNPDHLEELADKSPAFISTLSLSPTTDAILRESARYLLHTRSDQALSA